MSPKKVYAIDTGLVRANSTSFSEDEGRALENVVFLKLRGKTKELYFYKGVGECDFLVMDSGRIVQAFQVCSVLDDDNMKRELNGLEAAMRQFNLKTGTIITLDQRDRLGDIEVLPVWDWLLRD